MSYIYGPILKIYMNSFIWVDVEAGSSSNGLQQKHRCLHNNTADYKEYHKNTSRCVVAKMFTTENNVFRELTLI